MDETITVDTARLPRPIRTLMFAISSYTGKRLGGVAGLVSSVVDASPNFEEQVRRRRKAGDLMDGCDVMCDVM